MKKKIPLIKEYRTQKLKKCLKCIDKFAYHREKQRDCVISLYPNTGNKTLEHREKSIFRGMVIPSLRYLGLIIGFGDNIKPSANGKLIIESKFNNKLYERCWRSIVFEIDKTVFNFLPYIVKQKVVSKKDFIVILSKQIFGTSEKPKKERIEKWLSILQQVGLIEYSYNISINKEIYNQLLADINPALKDFNRFCEYVVEGYYNLGKNSAGVVDIRELREVVGVQFLKNDQEILTETQFDDLFREFISAMTNFKISLGEPMGADQKLFEYKNNFYKTVIIRKREVFK